MSRKAWKTLFSLCGEFFLVSVFFLCWMLKIEVGLNCYSVVDSELLPKLVHCCEHQLKRLVWGAEGYGWNPNLKVFWRCVDTCWTSRRHMYRSFSLQQGPVMFPPCTFYTQPIVCAALSVLPECLELHKCITAFQGTQQVSCALPLILLHYRKF